MRSKHIALLILLAGTAFFNSFFNGFTGDDEVMIVKNDFYQSWRNLPENFKPHYIAQSKEFFLKDQYFTSGAVSYRPVGTFFYFVDRALWKLNPAGYHFTSLLFHLLNTVLVYIVMGVLVGSGAALWIGLLFAVHPVQVEAVCSISYRHDLIATFFILLSWGSFIKYVGTKNAGVYVLSLLTYVLALFSKESALVLPAMFMLYQLCFQKRPWKELLKQKFYIGYFLVTAFYLYFYILVFPNSAVGENVRLGVVTIGRILSQYVAFLLLPFAVNPLPPLYAPQGGLTGLEIWGFLGLFFLIAIWIKNRKLQSVQFFFLSWFFIFLLPVANFVPLANPMAHRFLYLPAIGFFAFTVVFLQERWKFPPQLGRLLAVSILLLCAAETILVSYLWKNNALLASAWIDDYPQHDKGYSILGIEYFKADLCPEAKDFSQKALDRRSSDPRLYYILGVCSEGEPQLAAEYLQKAIALYPKYSSPYWSLGKLYFKQGRYSEALEYFQKYHTLSPDYYSYEYLVRTHLTLGQNEQAVAVLEDAKTKLPASQISELEKKFSQ